MTRQAKVQGSVSERFWIVANQSGLTWVTDRERDLGPWRDTKAKITGPLVREARLEATVALLAALDGYVGHRQDCSALSGAPECSCGFDDLYTRVRAVVRGEQ